MNSTFKYRIVAITLVVVFGVFNIGIPIVVASCSMPEMMRGSNCPMCNGEDLPTAARFAVAQNAACCTMTIVAERNTAEFVQGSPFQMSKHLLLESTVEVLPLSALHSLFSVVPRIASSPPAVIDIPIITSSLLI